MTRTVTLVLLALIVGCSQGESSQTQSAPSPLPTPNAVTSPEPSTAPESPTAASPDTDSFTEAINVALSATTISQSAVSPKDWQLVAVQWQNAISLMESVPTSHPNQELAQSKVAQYQNNLAYAQQQAAKAVPSEQPPANTASAQTPPTQIRVASKTTSPESASTADNTSTQSSPVSAELALANHLTQIGAKMYGAYWCPYCQQQKELFGEAYSQINYIECDANGENPQPQLCRQANIRSFPTWEINGQLYPGLHSLDELADLSEYQGDRNFGR